MKANLKLVVNTHIAQPRTNTSFDAFNIRDLALNRPQGAGTSDASKPSYLLCAAVIFLHIAGMVGLLNHKPKPPEIKPVTPMMVSLVSNPIPEPEVVPLVQPEPKPVVKPIVKPVVKQKPIVKEKVLTPEPVTQHAVVSEPVSVPETPPAPETPVVEAKAPVVAEAPKVEPPEPVTEPPKFGAAYLHNPAPNYPPSSRRAGEEGRVLLRVLVATNGNAETVELENSSGFAKLDEAAIKAVKTWRFIPAKRSNQAVSAYVLVPVKFSLDS